jgi:hypothetical protein
VPIAERDIRFSYTWHGSTVSVATLANGTPIDSTVYTRLYPDGD